MTYPINWDAYKKDGIVEGDYNGALDVDQQAYEEGDVDLEDIIAYSAVEDVKFELVEETIGT